MTAEQQKDFIDAVLSKTKEQITKLIDNGTIATFGEKHLRRFIHEMIAADFDYPHWWQADELSRYRQVIIDNDLFSHTYADGYVVAWTLIDTPEYGRPRHIHDMAIYHDYNEGGTSAADQAHAFMDHLQTVHGPAGDGTLYTAHLCHIIDSTEKELLTAYELSAPDNHADQNIQ